MVDDEIEDAQTLSAAGKALGTPARAIFRGFPVADWEKYEFVSYIGAGGMGDVYKALDPRLKRHVALKFIRGDDPILIKRFLREAQAQAQVEHENVCKVFETGEVDGKLYIAMHYIAGVTLRQAQNEMSVEQKVRLMKKVAEGVHEAHRLGLIHRDIKPSNIMVDRTEDGDWRPYVMDFGLVREAHAEGVTMTGSMLGTPGYMSPEQAWGEAPLDRRTDVYSLGATLYEIVSNHLPVEGSSTIEILKKLLQEEAVPIRKQLPSVPRDLEIIIMKCLERDPQQRYDSARALAEDMQRYLDGDPIQARPPSLTYRLQKRVRKNKALVGVIAIALLAVTVLGFMAISSSLQAGRRAAAAQRFGQQVEKMDAVMRIGHTIPIHDIRQEKKIIHDQMKSIQTQMNGLGNVAAGPGEYALGRGYLSLDEYRDAVKHLEKSWQLGYREPEVSYALGLALGQLFRKELEEIDLIQNESERARRRAEAERTFRDPAIRYLQSVRGLDVASPEYVEGLIDYFEKEYDASLLKADAAFKQLPWFYEALLLKGDVQLAIAGEERNKGQYAPATQAYEKAEGFYREAVRIGESDIHGFDGLAEVSMGVLNLQTYEKGGDLNAALNRILEASDSALKIDPEMAGFYDKKSTALRLVAEDQLNHGQDPAKTLELAIRESEKALSIDPNDAKAYANLGTAQQILGENDFYSGKDPGNRFNIANENLMKAQKLNPKDTYTYNVLCIGFLDQGNYENSHGKDPEDSFRKGIEYGKKSVSINPKNLSPLINLGNAFNYLALYKQDHGSDPSPEFKEAIATYEKAMEINPNSMYLNNDLGGLYIHLGDYERLHGLEPASYAKGIRYLEKAEQLNPEDAFPYFNHRDAYTGSTDYDYEVGKDPAASAEKAFEYFYKGIALNDGLAGAFSDQAIVSITMARYAIENAIDPGKHLREARQLLQKALSIDASKATAFLHTGEIEMLEGLWQKGKGQPAQGSSKKAETALQRSIEINAQTLLPYLRLAELRLFEAQGSKDATVLVDSGLEQIGKAIKLNPGFAESYAVKSRLLKQRGSMDESRAALAEALKINPNLKRRYGADEPQSHKE